MLKELKTKKSPKFADSSKKKPKKTSENLKSNFSLLNLAKTSNNLVVKKAETPKNRATLTFKQVSKMKPTKEGKSDLIKAKKLETEKTRMKKEQMKVDSALELQVENYRSYQRNQKMKIIDLVDEGEILFSVRNNGEKNVFIENSPSKDLANFRYFQSKQSLSTIRDDSKSETGNITLGVDFSSFKKSVLLRDFLDNNPDEFAATVSKAANFYDDSDNSEVYFSGENLFTC